MKAHIHIPPSKPDNRTPEEKAKARKEVAQLLGLVSCINGPYGKPIKKQPLALK